jgi:hypothetical protein
MRTHDAGSLRLRSSVRAGEIIQIYGPWGGAQPVP